MNFFAQLLGSDAPFLRCAVASALAASIAFGLVGSLVVTRRISSIAGAIAHVVLGGIGVALYLQRVWHIAWFTPMLGAFVSAILAALVIGVANLYAKAREDTIIGVVWAVGMAVGLLFLARTPGYVDLQGYLFGNILLATPDGFYWTLVLDAVIVLLTVLFFNSLLAMSFDRNFAALRGVHVTILHFLLLILVALTIVMMVSMVGIILLIALLVLPAATAGNLTRRLWQMMALATVLSMICSTLGLMISFEWDLPSGPVIVMIAATGYALSIFLGKFFRR